MEFLIFGIASLFFSFIALFICLTPFYLSFLIGKSIDHVLSIRGVRYVFPIILLALIATWGYATNQVFRQLCKIGANQKSVPQTHSRPDGFVFVNKSSLQPGGGVRWDEAIRQGHFRYVATAFPRNEVVRKATEIGTTADYHFHTVCAGKILSQSPKVVGVQLGCKEVMATLQLKAVVLIQPEKKIKYWWHPPIYELEMQAKDLSNNSVLASSMDYVIGGGIVGQFLKMFGGDQDFNYLSCGYVSKDVGPWRPSLTSRPRYKHYEEADLSFVLKAFGAGR